MTKRIVGGIALCGFLMAVSVQVHHSFTSVYDMKKESEVAGAVESVKFVHPHGR